MEGAALKLSDVEGQPPLPQPQTTIRLVIGQTAFTHNGIAAQSDVAPFIDPAYNRTMVPLALIVAHR